MSNFTRRLHRSASLVIAAGAALAATLVAPMSPAHASSTHASSTHGSSTVPPAGLESIPHFDHVVVLVEENEAESTTFGSASPAKYLNSLRAKGEFLPDYYGTGHASLDNYIAMVSGQPDNPASAGDCAGFSLYECAQIQSLYANGRNLGDQLDAAHVSWKSYQDTPPVACFHQPYSSSVTSPDPYQGDTQKGPGKDYADRHNPFIWFPDFVGNPGRCAAHQVPISVPDSSHVSSLYKDLAANTLPAFSFISPDTCHDGHDNPCSDGQPGGLVSLDKWAKQTVPALLDYLWQHNGLLIINFDEGAVDFNDDCPSCASGGIGGRTGAILLSPRLKAGTVVSTSYDHFSLLRTIEDSFQIGEHLNLAGNAQPMADAFKGVSG